MVGETPVDGTRVFGIDPAGYDRARPDYPRRVYDLIEAQCPIGPHTHAFEIGAGSGIATRQLLARGLGSLVAIEPNQRLAAFLADDTRVDQDRLAIQVSTFVDAPLPASSFDLGLAATTFHWLDPGPTLEKVVRLLRPGGHWAMWWNTFGDPGGDPFHEATRDLMLTIEPAERTDPSRRPTFPLDATARLSELAAAGLVEGSAELIRWRHPYNASQTQALYATFPHIRLLPRSDHERVLAELGRIVDDEFGGVVERTMLTPLYIARRP